MAAPLALEQPSVNKAWQAFLQHIPVFVVIYLSTTLLTLIGFAIYFAIVMIAAAASGGNSDAALSLATALGQLAQLPVSLITSLLSVLIVAVPALYYERGEVVTIEAAWQLVIGRFWRYLLAGVFFSVAMTIGFVLCLLPGIAVALVTPVYVNRIFVTEMSIGEAFSQSFQVVYRSENGLSFVGLEVLTGIIVGFATLLTCGLGGFVFVPMASFYLQNVAYNRGLLR